MEKTEQGGNHITELHRERLLVACDAFIAGEMKERMRRRGDFLGTA